ncbi:ADP-ribose glycohydrolase OARD1-like isoform X2 [Chiloscyllium punctatum]|uniref:ADP-ribose glycohydrolase OARD1-like isoform X2 n=1 Tax=Chiloscyllium punctatum TaxID=137246 RepID=UPI003B634251
MDKPLEGSSFEIHYVTGDLFKCPEQDALAHCISEDLRMGAGIAVVFKRMFQSVEELLSQKKKVGDVAVLKTKQRYVYYLITKKASYQKPTYENLQSSLEAMKEHCLKHGISRISMPRGRSYEDAGVPLRALKAAELLDTAPSILNKAAM